MITLSMRGLRGGVGSTSLLAGLGYALQHLGERVLMVDLCVENLLRLHFNLAFAEAGGWARSALNGDTLKPQTQTVDEGLALIPYGALDDRECTRVEALLAEHPGRFARWIKEWGDGVDWLLFDLPQQWPAHTAVGTGDMQIRVLEADPACDVLLGQTGPVNAWWLVNRYDPSHLLQRDLQLVWRQQEAQRFVPISVHRDAAMAEALACRAPVGRYASDSQAANDVDRLAAWCRAQVAR